MKKVFPPDSPTREPGIKNISRLIDEIDEGKDYWLAYEVGSSSLTKHLYDVKGEFFKGERVYHVHHQALFQGIKQNKNLMR